MHLTNLIYTLQPQHIRTSTYRSYDETAYAPNHKVDPYLQQNRQSYTSSIGYGAESVVLRNSGGTTTGRRMEPTIRESIEVMPGPSSMYRPATIIVPEPDKKSIAIAELEMKHEKEIQILRHTIADLEAEVDRLKREKITLENQNVQYTKFHSHLEKETKISKQDKYSWNKFLLQFKLFNRPSKEQLQKKNILKGEQSI